MPLLSARDGEQQELHNSMSMQQKHRVNISDFSNDNQAKEIGGKDLELHGHYKGQLEAFRSTALLLAKLSLDDTLENL
ncbi:MULTISPECIES: hypothetical protein [Bacillus cereus group]|uniref:hypothetical protein n=1 Tax=Bacillus cereus group TaxID=86661 RepID=UPI00124EF484|nr:hypothetical protein [Bacillus cereus]KAB2419666.1 hypothetical protein F8167_26905 [Bacillus cereus]